MTRLNTLLLGLVGTALIIQFIPYGKVHENPPVVAEPQWDSDQTKELFRRACADCHSHETKYPWYSYIAPVSWLVQHDIDEGREHFNVSQWGIQKKNKGKDAAEEVEEGEMPILAYISLRILKHDLQKMKKKHSLRDSKILSVKRRKTTNKRGVYLLLKNLHSH